VKRFSSQLAFFGLNKMFYFVFISVLFQLREQLQSVNSYKPIRRQRCINIYRGHWRILALAFRRWRRALEQDRATRQTEQRDPRP